MARRGRRARRTGAKKRPLITLKRRQPKKRRPPTLVLIVQLPTGPHYAIQRNDRVIAVVPPRRTVVKRLSDKHKGMALAIARTNGWRVAGETRTNMERISERNHETI